MAKIILNNKEYQIDDATLTPATNSLKSHFSTVMTGEGAVIALDGVEYGIDDTKLSAAKNDFVAHLGTIAGNGLKVVVGGVEYGIDPSKVANAFEELESAFDSFNSDSNSGGDVITFNGDLSLWEYVDMGDGMYYVKITDSYTPAENFIGVDVTYTDQNEVFEEKITEDYVRTQTAGDAQLVAIYAGINMPMLLSIKGDLSSYGYPKEGTYFVYYEADEYNAAAHMTSITNIF